MNESEPALASRDRQFLIKKRYLKTLNGRIDHLESSVKFWMHEFSEHGDECASNELRHVEDLYLRLRSTAAIVDFPETIVLD